MSKSSPAQVHYSTDADTLQDLFVHKQTSLLLADSFDRLSQSTGDPRYINKAITCRECGTYIGIVDNPETGRPAIARANFCRQRLCPLCARRRSLRIYGATSRILDWVDTHHQCKYLLLTLTLRNCPLDELRSTMDTMQQAWAQMRKRPAWRRRVMGAMRTLEVTINRKTREAHPHYHLLLAVPKEYGRKTNDLYWSADQWAEQWGTALNAGYKPIIHIQLVRGTKQREHATAEVAKYLAKGDDYIIRPDESTPLAEAQALTDKLVSTLGDQIIGKRMVAYVGWLRDAQRALALEDPEEGPLTDYIRGDLVHMIRHYHWRPGVGYTQGGPGKED